MLWLDQKGPWTWATWIPLGPTQFIRANFYGHSGGKTNLAFTDAHVEPVRELKVKMFLLD